ncbi:MAG: Ig-like domain-containing protein, partial [Bacteroidales bacterium]|nr:Ig-like domain-containing protein [Bacteroidales bacterium]
MQKKKSALSLLLLSVLLIFSCTAPVEDIPVGSISLDKPSLELQEGEVAQLKATVLPKNATDTQVTWSSSNPEVASVDKSGLVTALTPGFVTITAMAGQKTATCQVRVSKKQVPVSGITLDRYSLEMVEGESAKITATILPQNATNATVTWSSSDSNIAVVDADGNVTAVKVGSATITAKAEDKTASCTVKVSSSVIPVSSISLDKANVTVTEGESFRLVASVMPENATDKTVNWSSSDETLASVDQNGYVKALAAGVASITAQAGDKTASCTVTINQLHVSVGSIILNKTSLFLVEGDSETLVATVQPDNASNKTVTWSSSDESIATVNEQGKVTAVKEGYATITAKAEDKTAECQVTVSKREIPVSSIVLNTNNVEMIEGESVRLVATVSPANATNASITWSSSNEAVATVDQQGLVTALKEGAADITAQAGDKTATCKVQVKPLVVPVTSIALNKTSLSLKEGESETLVATVSPDNATDKTVTWSSTNTLVATVDQSGRVTAMAEGTATITATAGDKSTTCSVTVSKNVVAVTSIALNKTSLSLKEGESETLVATVSPDNATDKTVTWSSTNTSIATVDASGRVTAIKEGTATITAKAGDKSATCSVTVSKNVVAVTSIALNKMSLSLKEGESETLVATVSPDNATDKTVTWSSTNTSVATVDPSGRVTAIKEGTATITAKAGEKSATCSVTVSKKVVAVTSIALDKTSLSLKEGESETLVATVSPDNATDKTVTWSSTNTSVATVDASGRVTAIKEGTATITAKAGD